MRAMQMSLVTAMFVTALMVATGVCAQEAPPVLLLGQGFTSQALDALEIEYTQAEPSDYARRKVNPFSYGVIIGGMDADRNILANSPQGLLAFVRTGGVFVGMRHNDGDRWLPSPVKMDKAYELGEIVEPEHPIFTTPNAITREVMADVHSGSIYRGFYDLGEGWQGLVSTGKEQNWDDTEAKSDEAHYGIVELKYGEGRIVLCQMIPEYDWFKDREGERGAGALLFENMMAYAMANAPEWAGGVEPSMPDCYRLGLTEVLPAGTRQGTWPLNGEGWEFEGSGAFGGKSDRRAVYTISHPDAPSEAGASGRVSRTVQLGDTGGQCWLRFYMSDDYCGGMDRTFEGDRVAASTENKKRDMRFAEVLVDGEMVWEKDVLGLNPRPATRRFYTVDISDATRGKDEVTVALQVSDRQGSGEAPFATEVFWAGPELLREIAYMPAVAMQAAGFEADEAGARLAEGAEAGTLTGKFGGNAGQYYVAVGLRDEHTGQSKLTVSADGALIGSWTMSADDFGQYQALLGPTRIGAGAEIRVEAERDGTEAVAIEGVTLLPRALVEAEPQADEMSIAAPCYQPGQAVRRGEFGVTVTDHAGAVRAGEIASHGMPFAYGALRSAENVRVLGPDGQEVARQVRGLNTWPDGSVMFALVSFPASVAAGETATYRVEYGSEVAATATPAVPLVVEETGDSIKIDAGPLEATLSKTTGTIFESALLDGREMVAGGEAWGAVVTREDGTSFSSATDSVTDVQVVEAGPLRAIIRRIGRHTAADGSTLLEYDMIQEFYAGSPVTRLRYVFTHKEDSATERLSRASLQMPAPWLEGGDALSSCVWLDEAAGVAQSAEQVIVRQHDLDAAEVRVGAGEPVEAGRTRGWARVSNGPGLAVATRWWWEKFPKAVEAGPGGVTLDLIPENSHTTFSDGPFVQYQGEGIGHEVMIAFEPQGTDAKDETVFRAFGDRLLATPDPGYACGTLALGETAPTDRRMFPRYEEQVNAMYEQYIAKREKRREYGMENYGDDTFEWGYGPSYTVWSDQEYDHQHGFLMQYFRSGDRKFFEIGEQAARHQDEVDCYHWAPGREYLIGAPHHHNTKHIVDEGWFPDHCVAGAHVSHAWIEGLLDYWLMTGDVRTEEVARQMGDWFSWCVEENHYGAGGQERGPGWSLIALSSAYRITGEERYRLAAEQIMDWFEGMIDPVRGVVSVPVSEQPSYEGGTTFMHGIVGRGLGKYYEATGDERAMRLAVRIGEWITTEPMGPPGQFWYKQAPNCKKGYGATGQVMTALSYPYRYTGDEWFGEMSDALFAQTGPGSRSAAWTYMSLGHLAPRVTPLRIEMPDGKACVAPGTPWTDLIALTNTSAETMTIRISGASEGLKVVAEPAKVTIESGEVAEVKLTVSAPAGGVGNREVTVRLKSGEQVQERPLAVSVVEELVRVGSGTAQASLTGPFALVEEGERTWAHVPPKVRANPDPWKADDDAGAITWQMTVPVAGEYSVLAECWWPDMKSNSLWLIVDGGQAHEFGNDSRYDRWQWITGPAIRLAAGEHTVSLRAREDGARVARVALTNAGE